MKEQHGFTMVEMAVSVALSALLFSAAALVGVNWVMSARLSSAANRLADLVETAHIKALASGGRWIVRFEPADAAVADVISAQSKADPLICSSIACPGGRFTVELAPGIGIRVPKVDGGAIVLAFDRVGRMEAYESTDTELTSPLADPTYELIVCRTAIQADGTRDCQTGTDGRRLVIHRTTGAIEY